MANLIWLEAPRPSLIAVQKSVPPPPAIRPPPTPRKQVESLVAKLPSKSEDTQRESDSPRLAVLTPRLADSVSALRLDDSAGADEDTVTERQRVSSIVGTWLSGDVSGARARGGLVDSAYGELGAALRAATADRRALCRT